MSQLIFHRNLNNKGNTNWCQNCQFDNCHGHTERRAVPMHWNWLKKLCCEFLCFTANAMWQWWSAPLNTASLVHDKQQALCTSSTSSSSSSSSSTLLPCPALWCWIVKYKGLLCSVVKYKAFWCRVVKSNAWGMCERALGVHCAWCALSWCALCRVPRKGQLCHQPRSLLPSHQLTSLLSSSSINSSVVIISHHKHWPWKALLCQQIKFLN